MTSSMLAAQAKPQYESVRRNVYVSRPRPKRLPKDDIPVCSCCSLAPVPRGPPPALPPARPASAVPLSPPNAVGGLGPPLPARPFSAGAAPSTARVNLIKTLTLDMGLEALAGLSGVGGATGAGDAAAAASTAAPLSALPAAEQGTVAEPHLAACTASPGGAPERAPGAAPATAPEALAAAAPGSAAGSLVGAPPGSACADPAEVAEALVADIVAAVAAGAPHAMVAESVDVAAAQADGAQAVPAAQAPRSGSAMAPGADGGSEQRGATAAGEPGSWGWDAVQAAGGKASESSEQALAGAARADIRSTGGCAVPFSCSAAGHRPEQGAAAAAVLAAATASVAAAAEPTPPPPRDRCGENCLNRLSFITCDARLCPAGECCSNRCSPVAAFASAFSVVVGTRPCKASVVSAGL